MTSDAATIRVTRETRDLLAEQARRRGQSLSIMLSDVAHQFQRQAIFRAERDAARRDANATDIRAEEHEWESVLADGID